MFELDYMYCLRRAHFKMHIYREVPLKSSHSYAAMHQSMTSYLVLLFYTLERESVVLMGHKLKNNFCHIEL